MVKCKVVSCNDVPFKEGYCEKHFKDVERSRRISAEQLKREEEAKKEAEEQQI